MNNNEIITESLKLLDSNREWEEIYARYAQELMDNQKTYNDRAKKFHKPYSLVVYSTIGKVLDGSSTFSYDLRFAGQSVGGIKVKEGDIVCLYVSEKQSKYAKEHFGFSNSKEIKGEDWHSKEAREFRTFYGK